MFATGSVLTAWALLLGTDPGTVAVLQGLATAAQILHGPAGFLTAWIGRKRVAVWALMSARLVWAPMALYPLLGLDSTTATHLLIGVAALSAIFQVLGDNAWRSWMGDLVPARLRGRFYGARTTSVTTGAALASLASATLLESGLPRAITLSAIAALLCLCGLVSAGLLALLGESARNEERPQLGAYLEALRDPRARSLIAYQFAWGAAVAPGAAFFSLHVLGSLGASFFVLAGHAMLIAIVRLFTAPIWGRIVDRWSGQPVLVLCSLGISIMPLLWMITTPGRLWPLAIDAVLSGAMWGGHGVASFDLSLGIAKAHRRSYDLALFAMASGLGFLLSVLLSGWASQALAIATGGDLRPFFLMSAIGRAGCALIALRVHDADALGVGTWLARLPRSVTGSAR